MAIPHPNLQHTFQSPSVAPQFEPQPNAPAPTEVVQQAVPQLQPQQQAQQQAPQQQFQIAVSDHIVPGQLIPFTAPDGQRAVVTVQEHLQPGSVIHVQCPYLQPPCMQQQLQQQQPLNQAYEQPLLPPTTLSPEEIDKRASSKCWMLYGLSWLCFCCFNPIFGVLMWLGMASSYFCKPQQAREQSPRQRTVARVAAATLGVGCCCGILFALGAAGVVISCGGADLPKCPQLKHHHGHPGWMPHHHDHHHGHSEPRHEPNFAPADAQWEHFRNFDHTAHAAPKTMLLLPVNKKFLAQTQSPSTPSAVTELPPKASKPVDATWLQDEDGKSTKPYKVRFEMVLKNVVGKEKLADMREKWADMKAFAKRFHDKSSSMQKFRSDGGDAVVV